MTEKKKFDCVAFKEELNKNLLKKSGAKNLREYVKYVNEASKKSSLHKPRSV